jgi:2,3-bisphosphoglycerate-dependent phosphoglycerate mutase
MTSDDPAAQSPDQQATLSKQDIFLSLKGGATEIYLIRHADALPGAEEVTPGGYDDQPLSELGRRQARALGERLRDTHLAAVYSSPLGRARQTAEAVASTADLQVEIEPDLREVALGAIGPDFSAHHSPAEIATLIKDRLREIAEVAVTSGRWADIPASEPSAKLRARMLAVVHGIAARHAGQRVAAVSHGGAINAYFAALLGLERDYFFPAANTSISVVRVKGERSMLFAVNDIAHLREAALLGFDPSS